MAKRTKTVYSVSELPHVFFNRIALNGQRAGEHASTKDGALLAARHSIAAAFLIDATGPDGKYAAVITTNQDRWQTSELRAAVPKQTVHAVEHEFSPRDTDGSIFRSAERTCAALLLQMERALTRSINNAGDVAGESLRALAVDRMHRTYSALLGLTWHDRAAQEQARAALAKHDAHWLYGRDGYNQNAVRAIAQRMAIAKDADTAMQYVVKWHAAWNAVGAAQDEILDECADNLLPKINAIARYRRDESNEWMFTWYAFVQARMERIWRFKHYHEATKTLVRYESGNAPYCSFSFNDLPKSLKVRYDATAALRANAARRASAKDAVRDAYALRDEFLATEVAVANLTTTFDPASEGHRNLISSWSRNWSWQAERAFETSHKQLPEIGDTDRVKRLEDALTQLKLKADTYVRTNAVRVAYERTINQLTELQPLIATKPRWVQSRIAAFGYNYSYSDITPEMEAQYKQLVTKLCNACIEAERTVSGFNEWINGGLKPSIHGDWFRIEGNRVHTSRNVQVSLRAVRAALAFVKAQPDGPFSCSFDIGGFTLTGRDSAGNIIVGCHKFSPDAVAAFEQQLAARTEAPCEVES